MFSKFYRTGSNSYDLDLEKVKLFERKTPSMLLTEVAPKELCVSGSSTVVLRGEGDESFATLLV